MLQIYHAVGGWETDVSQYTICGGQLSASGPYYATNNHIGLCGQMNVFFDEQDECSIYDIPQESLPESGKCRAIAV